MSFAMVKQSGMQLAGSRDIVTVLLQKSASSRLELAERFVACLHDLTAWHPGERVLMVAHGGVLNCLFNFVLELDWHASRRFSLFNTALNSFSITIHEWRFETWGDRTHLQGLPSLDDT